jgi:RNA-splicing ligase RtcB
MSIKYLVKEELIPDDGSKEIIENFYNKTEDKTLDLLVYPDVHYKKGSRVANGMLTSSDNNIYPAMLGVANCGFTFGKIENVNIEQREKLEKSFEEYSKKLKAYNNTKVYTNEEIYDIFYKYLDKFYNDEKYKELFEFLDINSLDNLKSSVQEIFNDKHIDVASKTLGTLGGGNHFFELQYVEDSYNSLYNNGDIIFILHSDSIAVGETIMLLFSNLSELGHLGGIKGNIVKLLNKIRQIQYFTLKNGLFFKEPKEILNLLYSQDDFRTIDATTQTGKSLIKAFFLSTIFGDMNRDMILKNYEKTAKEILGDININILGSHSHDSLMVEKNDNKIKIVQRNGVQCIVNDQTFILPGALGTESYLMSNPNNEEAYHSSNHGVGRFLDKHLAKKEFDEQGTEAELKKRNMKLYRVGKGNISEQNPNAFKDVFAVTEMMKKENLGERVAKLRPICSMKG